MNENASDSEQTQRLLRKACDGDQRALSRLLERHRPYLRQMVELRLDPRIRARVDPSDVVQEAQLEAVRRLQDDPQPPPLPFRLWLRQLASDRLLMLRRYHVGAARRSVQREVALPERSSLQLFEQLVASGPTPSHHLNQREQSRRVRDAVARLPEKDREVLLMRTFEGLSFAEVAYVLRLDAAAVRKRYGRALLRLHKFLTNDDQERPMS
jgi:RNA polymerase sigma-70 factor (ECF subfamily)